MVTLPITIFGVLATLLTTTHEPPPTPEPETLNLLGP